ncbi:MAG: hypothetical protein COT91_01970 [Candidatus Doudnabacteria bacterium CG10_big_fil_rev_8_21_14_0_10_41_10]|uniref:Uncharacterized protein n=1 Tax=Candidatus Doudnabacteria bacterium CG10_big_fil_rev_8_21_14_0_10_41_10 TaxID=1974551 RepID=A0A2H0VG90_9BACT|nr:MAG: hypothetical protein COT91_01970 [Candidatus Doudnabacteria bacterium CG10_big_fil_rev_8_21_14_0_10_41_10]
MISSISLLIFLGFQALSYIIGLNETTTFLLVAVVLYLYMVFKLTFIFDLNLKKARAWEESVKHYKAFDTIPLRNTRIILRAIKLRFHYLTHWSNWRHFQNYLILPGFLYWSIIILFFLNPFDLIAKQIFVVVGTLLLTVILWHFKMVFITYGKASIILRYLLFASTILTSFLIFSGILGLKWYFGISDMNFITAIFASAFLLFYQSLFHRDKVNLKNLFFVLLGVALVALGGYFITLYWRVNFYSAGALLAGVAYTYWGIFLLHLTKRLTFRQVMEHAWVMAFVLLYVLATTNFSARIG